MISLDCPQCEAHFVTATPRRGQEVEDFRAAWKADAAQNEDVYTCVGCGGRFNISDDGIDVSQGGSVKLDDVSPPRIDSVTIGSGARTGGEALYVIGSALDVGSLVVKFGGKEVLQVTNREADRARVVTPTAKYTLNVDQINSGTFLVGEEVYGANSGAKGAVLSLSPFVVDNPTRAFSPFEEVLGTASSASLSLTGVPYSGDVDVTVENEHGQRLSGGTLVSGFTYQ